MIVRLWMGWTTPENADVYENLLKSEIFPGIAAKTIDGYLGIELWRRPIGDEVEFATLMRFRDWAAVKAFAGGDHENSYVPDAARKVLRRFDDHSRHYELRDDRPGG